MFNNAKLELAGPVGVAMVVAGAELGAHALAYWPSSPLLWYLNLEVFRPVQYSLVAERSVALGGLAQTLCVAAPLLGLTGIGLITKARLPLAVASSLSLVYSALLMYASFLANSPAEAMGVALSFLWVPSSLLAASVLLASLLSSAISHRTYWRELFP
jgi:hypothetical protein